MTVLLFGANSQDGYYLETLCSKQGYDTYSVSRSAGIVKGDVSDYTLTENLIKKYRPVYIFHLAANSTTRHSALFENHQTISTGTLNILESVKKHSPSTKVFITGSGLQFKNSGRPISEKDEFEALSPYAVARIQSVYAARYYRSLGIRIYVGYLFHHESPKRKPNHVSKMISSAVQRIAKGSNEMIEIGDITVEKEWGYAGDIVNGMLKLIVQDECFEATIGTGVTYTIQDWLEQCFMLIGKNWFDHVRLKQEFTPDYAKLVSDSTTIQSLGWQPEVSFKELARMMVMTK
nr:GDP-mannose 4,6-dehydratase [uncultured Desulfobacter sp.]